jgi:DNA-binding transcriptional LysR family regulator
MDRLTSLTAFVGVVDNGGFSAAARRLNMSTTMVSSHVQALEDRLGVRLLNRTTRKVNLTEVGKAYYDRATQILADLEQADDIASSLQSTPHGTLRVYVATHMIPFVAPVVTEFMSSYPEVKLEVMMGERDIDMVEEGVDLAVRLTPPRDASLITRSLATWRHVLCCSPGYIAKHGRPLRLADLAAHNCIRHIHYPFPDEWRFVDRAGAPAAAKISGTLVTNSGETLRQAALHGVGVGLAAGFLVHADLEEGRLVRLLPDYRPLDFAVNAIYPHRHHLSIKVRIFIDLLAKHSADQQKLINP